MTLYRLVAMGISAILCWMALPIHESRAVVPTQNQNQLLIFNWNNYIGRTTLADFTKATGIQVIYKEYSSNEQLEERLERSTSGIDIVVPTARPYFARMVQSGLFRPLDRSKIPNLSKLDPALMRAVQDTDPGNRYGIIYAWGTNGMGYNAAMIKERMADAPVHSWDMIFNPDIVKKFADCGVTMVNSGYEVLPLILRWLKLDPRSEQIDDIQAALGVMKAIRPYIRRFDSSSYIDDLAKGKICLALGWSGDIMQAKAMGRRQKNDIRYSIPDEGSMMWFDMMGVLRSAPHPDAAWAFINFILDPVHMADITNAVAYANAVPESLSMVASEIRRDANIFPMDTARSKLFTLGQPSPMFEEQRQRAWQKIVEDK